MKLYRGIKSSQYESFTYSVEKEIKAGLQQIFKERQQGGVTIYPEKLNKTVLRLRKLMNLTHQHFTDNKQIAYRYAKKEKGLLVEIDLNIGDVLKYFKVEFQNFSKRRQSFDLVYLVRSRDLLKNSKKWQLVVREI